MRPKPKFTLEVMTDELSLVIANARTKGNVYMSGAHNPLPSETKAAERFMAQMKYVGLLREDDTNAYETLALLVEVWDDINSDRAKFNDIDMLAFAMEEARKIVKSDG